jgi:hypothetical protein
MPSKEKFVATARIINASNKPLKGTLLGKYELINSFNTVEISKEKRNCLSSAIKTYLYGDDPIFFFL